jgi:acyl-CoA thioester hydrolase
MQLDVPVRWQDLDALGHVGHAVYLTYFEEQRDRWLFERVGLGGRDYVVASAKVDYEAPLALEDGPVCVSSHVERLGRSSITLDGEVRSVQGRVCARSRTAIVIWDRTRQRSRPLTPKEREALSD